MNGYNKNMEIASTETSSIAECGSCAGHQKLIDTLHVETYQLKNELLYYEYMQKGAITQLERLEHRYSTGGDEIEVSEKPQVESMPYSEYLFSLELPGSFFTVITNEDLAISFLLRASILPLKKTCACGQEMEIYKTRLCFLYRCGCGMLGDVLEGKIWKHLNLPLDKVLLCLFLWIVNVREREISGLTGISYQSLKAFCSHLRRIVSHHFNDTFVKFSGIVEIDESCFRQASADPLRKKTENWVFGLYERSTKRCYMEVVECRTTNKLLPIIQKICEPGTTIISDQWAAYNALSDYGFPHYIVDHSRYFVNPHNREIHTQHIEISWGWAKYDILRKSRRRGTLQELLNEFCWKRQFRQSTKLEEIAEIVKRLLSIISTYQDLEFSEGELKKA